MTPAPMTLRLAIFDCDGTLVDSQADIGAAMDDAFARCALPAPPRHATRRVVGLSLGEAIRQLHPAGDDALRDTLVEHYKDAFRERRSAGAVVEPLYDGIAALVAELDAAGWLLGVATGKSDRGLALCLERHGLAGHFVTLQTADRHPSKPHPAMLEAAMAEAGAAPETTVMIGDTSFDMMMAAKGGAHALGVDWGYHTAEELRAAGALDVLDHARELPGWMERFR